MASNDFVTDGNPSEMTSLQLPPPLSPHNAPHQSFRTKEGKVNSSHRIRNRYQSAFTEIGLDGAADTTNSNYRDITSTRPGPSVRWRSQVEIHEVEPQEERDMLPARSRVASKPWLQSGPSATVISRLSFVAVILAIMIPVLHMSPLLYAGPSSIGAEAGPIVPRAARHDEPEHARIAPRQSSSVDACLRWSHQAAVVNGTLYLYGGRSKRDSNQASNTWNNNFLKMDLKTGWQISSPTIEEVPRPSEMPATSNGFLWNSRDKLYLYGGEYSDNPEASPVPYSLWTYNIPSSTWEERKNPRTIDGVAVERSAEGSGVNIPSLGRGMYFGGHIDRFTTPGWDISIFRVYLRSLLEFTFPGSANPAVKDNKPAGPDGIWRNLTDDGVQDSAGFTERADGVLVYVPGYSKQGILLGLAGGTNKSYTQMNVIDVYDIAEQRWYKQATTGPIPEYRVNPCAVATSAADGSSVQVHLFAGQKLLPYGSQEQHDDMWILSIPSFTWIQVDQKDQPVPPSRAGHTCTVWNAQMIVIGGYVGQDLSCDSPGVYVFNTSSLRWNTNYAALKGGNEMNQQKAQEADPTALPGSYGYTVPDAVQKVIGGNAFGSATVTAPAQIVTAGPFATGKPIIYTVTQSDGSVATETATPGAGRAGSNGSSSGPNIAAIIAGVLAGLFFLLAIYLGFCTWVYRRQLALYKRHVAMSQRQSMGIAPPPIVGLGGGGGGGAAAGTRLGADSPLEKSSLDATSASSSSNARNAAAAAGRGVGGYHALPTTNNTFAGGLERTSTNSVHGGLNTARSSTDDLLDGQEPTFLGVLLSPRRSLKVINRD